MTLLNSTAKELLSPLQNLWNSFVKVLPGILYALVVLIIGYLIATAIGRLVKIVLSKLRVDKGFHKLNLPESIGKIRVSSVLGELTKWYIFIIFIQSAASAVKLGALSLVLNKFVLWLPNLIIAVLALLVGLFIAHYLSHLLEREAEMKGMKIASKILNIVIIFLAFVIALGQIGVQVSILKDTFLILLGSVGIGCALAMGLAFGLGLKDEARGLFRNLRKKI